MWPVEFDGCDPALDRQVDKWLGHDGLLVFIFWRSDEHRQSNRTVVVRDAHQYPSRPWRDQDRPLPAS